MSNLFATISPGPGRSMSNREKMGLMGHLGVSAWQSHVKYPIINPV